MEIFTLDQDIPILYITAESFPLGILPAHEKLHSIIPFNSNRKYFGISAPNASGSIQYKAAAEQLNSNEAALWKLDKMIIPKGNFLSLILYNFHKDIESIGNTFRQMLTDPRIDHQGFCIEWYINQHDVRCMVRLDDAHK